MWTQPTPLSFIGSSYWNICTSLFLQKHRPLPLRLRFTTRCHSFISERKMIISGVPGYHQVTGVSLSTISKSSRESQNGSGGKEAMTVWLVCLLRKKKGSISWPTIHQWIWRTDLGLDDFCDLISWRKDLNQAYMAQDSNRGNVLRTWNILLRLEMG